MDEGYGTRQWPKLRQAGVPALLRKAAAAWDNYGFCQHANQDTRNAAVDIVGALHLAAGAKYANMDSVPPNTNGTLHIAIEFIESSLEEDLYAWNDTPGRTKEDAARLLTQLADRLETTI